jgi:hypothetical protein
MNSDVMNRDMQYVWEINCVLVRIRNHAAFSFKWFFSYE